MNDLQAGFDEVIVFALDAKTKIKIEGNLFKNEKIKIFHKDYFITN